MFRVTSRIYATANGRRFLAHVPGDTITDAEAKRLGLIESEPEREEPEEEPVKTLTLNEPETAAEIRAWLDHLGIAYPAGANKAKLRTILEGSR